MITLIQGLLGTVLGGALVILGGWLADRRKLRNEKFAAERRERALLTGMFAVRNHIAHRLNEWEQSGLLSQLEPLRSALTYVERLIEKTPAEGEALMIAVIEIGLKLDTLIGTIDRRSTDPALKDQVQLASVITLQVEELVASLHQFDAITSAELSMLSEDDIKALSQVSPDHSDTGKSTQKKK
jgi:hypothetical protein